MGWLDLQLEVWLTGIFWYFRTVRGGYKKALEGGMERAQ